MWSFQFILVLHIHILKKWPKEKMCYFHRNNILGCIYIIVYFIACRIHLAWSFIPNKFFCLNTKTTCLNFSMLKYFNSMILILFLPKNWNIFNFLWLCSYMYMSVTADVLLLAMNLIKLRDTIDSSSHSKKWPVLFIIS